MLVKTKHLGQWNVSGSKDTWSSLVTYVLLFYSKETHNGSQVIIWSPLCPCRTTYSKKNQVLLFFLIHKYINCLCLLLPPEITHSGSLVCSVSCLIVFMKSNKHIDIKCPTCIIWPIRMWDNFIFLSNLISHSTLLPQTRHYSKPVCMVLPHCF